MIEFKMTAGGIESLADELERIAGMVREGYIEGEVEGGHYWSLNEDYEQEG